MSMLRMTILWACVILGVPLLFKPLLFFFSWYGYHRELHSFPTRRSSDLLKQIPFKRRTFAYVADEKLPFDLRSEEHTSELQSHHDLVCRLLLEKKKY